ncbi:MAG: rod shape-determining protein MreC [Alphaproteobacteria bacterium]|nr:rod shape-determining protein MreC [Alphaproteobacteria bacterium]
MARAPGDRKRGRKSNGFAVHGILFFLCISLITLGKADISAMNSIRTVLTGLVTPIADVVSVPVRAAAGMIEGMQAVANLREENRRLEDQVKRLSRWRLKAEILQTENRQLRSVSGVIIPNAVQPVSARVIAVNADSFAHSVMINAGRDAGIRKGNAVTTTDGLVGMIIDVGARHAQVLLLTDINAMIPVILSSSSWPATTVGQNSTSLRLRFLPVEASIEIDELVQTSGHGGVLPPGLPVGRVAAVSDDRIVVEPVVDLQRLSFVTVLVTEDDPGFSVDDVLAQTHSPLPPADNSFTLKGLNALGQRTETDVSNAGNSATNGN